MKKIICALLVILLCFPLYACNYSASDAKMQSAYTNETSSFQPLLPEYAQELLPQLLTPVDSVYDSMNWDADQFVPCQVTHLQFTGDPIEFYGQEMVLYLTPTLLPSEEQRIKESSLYDFSNLPIPKNETQNYLQRFAYVSFFYGEDSLSKACDFMSILDSNFRALYGSPNETDQHAYASHDPKEFFEKMEADTTNPDQHYLTNTWNITPADIHGLQHSLIISIVQSLDDHNIPVYRIALSYEWKLDIAIS